MTQHTLARKRELIKSAALRIIHEFLEKPRNLRMAPRRGLLSPPPLSSFKNLEPLGWGVSTDDEWLFNTRGCKPDLIWPLNVGYIMDKAGIEGVLTAVRYSTVKPKDVRGVVSRFSQYMVREDSASIFQGNLTPISIIFSWVGGKWVEAHGPSGWTGTDRDHPSDAAAVALRQRYEWGVSLGLVDSPSIRFNTDPTGIKALFKIRDIPEGRDRRDMLMTWVSDHWRQNRHDPEIDGYVRKHLRGSVQFNWSGMDCLIQPSQFDLDTRDKLIKQREDMRIDGTDRRPIAS